MTFEDFNIHGFTEKFTPHGDLMTARTFAEHIGILRQFFRL